ncbi:GntR family transcriptional regulator [Pseudorhodoferax sp. Leaf267]|uniref:GntR family transcriptional regulator n=1 Tax=Pseudorhodoferax sp. Leaf267 TaxID=1736316 RepID=UPI0006FB0122|nr:GntR family transcriptional regulator [Pseudorhodoferax sp. Leaf267]KQP22092.1 GntR family transcriptional regulator [Pseudorhodoferax sp. Leaf267]
MSVVSLTPRALYEEVAELLRQRIFSRELAPGSWIDELKLAEEYGISRTPLREALKVLAAEGLVTMKVRRGAYVTEVSETDLRDVYHLLGLLEGDAAAAVARDATPEQLDELEALHAQLEAAKGSPNSDRFYDLNVQFHARLLGMANNRWREQMVNDLRKLMRLARISSLHKAGRVDESLQEHADVLAALRRRDPEAAMACMRKHFQSGFTAAL